MVRRIFGISAAVGMAAGATAGAWAHHSFAMFDRDTRLRLTGTIQEFQWVNPHTWVQIDVPDANGTVTEWSIEGRSPNVLSRRGWNRNTLKPGDRVTLTVHPLKNGRPGGAIIEVKFPDGRVIDADTPSAVDTREER